MVNAGKRNQQGRLMKGQVTPGSKYREDRPVALVNNEWPMATTIRSRGPLDWVWQGSRGPGQSSELAGSAPRRYLLDQSSPIIQRQSVATSNKTFGSACLIDLFFCRDSTREGGNMVSLAFSTTFQPSQVRSRRTQGSFGLPSANPVFQT